MHEFSVVEGIVNTVIETALQNNAKEVYDIILEVGELTFLGKEQLIFSFDVIKKETILKNTKLIVNDVKATINCPKCNYSGAPAQYGSEAHISIPLLKCPECEAFGVDVISGKDCIIKGLNIEVE